MIYMHNSYLRCGPSYLFIYVLCFLTIGQMNVGAFGVQPQRFNSFFFHIPSDASEKRPNMNALLLSKSSTRMATVKSMETSQNKSEMKSLRCISKVEKFSRLPVWPAWNGVFLFLFSKLFGEESAAKLEDAIGGRVCPNFFTPEDTSPFVMLVHHRHSFAPWDPLRFFQRSFFPEGFPAHPHRGFITVTYCLKGGMVHRDSLGLKQTYGAEKRHNGRHTQWLTAGAGMLHEEMWDISPDNDGMSFLQPSSQELYQLWLNLPSEKKMTNPRIQLLGGEDKSTPVVLGQNGDTETIIIAGEHGGEMGSVDTSSEVTILHVKMKPGSSWFHFSPDRYETALIYMRTGSALIDGKRIPPHYTAYLSPYGQNLIVEADGSFGSDFLFLSGVPIKEPVAANGSMVMNYPDEINQAYADYQVGKMGMPWKETLSDEEWVNHVHKYPSLYKEEDR